MDIEVLLFAALREAAGTAHITLNLEDGSRAAAVIDELARRLPERRALLDRSAVAINEEYSAADALLKEGDTVAVIPPVSGG